MTTLQPQHALVAILRGLPPDQALAVGDALFEAGFRCIEVPLNSPRALDSVTRLREHFQDQALVGAGTVLTAQAVDDVAGAGGRIVVSPNVDLSVIARTKALGLVSLPGFFTPTEAFAALAAGADAIKLFPAEVAGLAGYRAIGAVLPRDAAVYAVGGVGPASAPAWRAAGVAGLGLGSAVFKPGMAASEVRERAAAMVAAWGSGAPAS